MGPVLSGMLVECGLSSAIIFTISSDPTSSSKALDKTVEAQQHCVDQVPVVTVGIHPNSFTIIAANEGLPTFLNEFAQGLILAKVFKEIFQLILTRTPHQALGNVGGIF
ncbi:MAG: hypothetical protein QOH35_4708 [Acidobacteriaceae bacterium]|nr:hypothetical protein [Acidobacteriaceae bacterium]MDX6462229.1 hypothetical protein [Acidobacteriaceae bacterium]MEA2543342.1 hypothetical protein [Acidobacteriaceae bacterium]